MNPFPILPSFHPSIIHPMYPFNVSIYLSIYSSIHPSNRLSLHPFLRPTRPEILVRAFVTHAFIHSFTNAFNTASNISTASEPYSLKNTCKSTEVEITNTSKVLPAQLSFSWTKFHSPPETL